MMRLLRGDYGADCAAGRDENLPPLLVHCHECGPLWPRLNEQNAIGLPCEPSNLGRTGHFPFFGGAPLTLIVFIVQPQRAAA
jgi:hypothetical protein